MRPSNDKVTVYYVSGLDKDGNVIELAKFFDAKAAADHRDQLIATHRSRQAIYKEIAVLMREELLKDQHYAHGGEVGKPQE